MENEVISFDEEASVVFPEGLAPEGLAAEDEELDPPQFTNIKEIKRTKTKE